MALRHHIINIERFDNHDTHVTLIMARMSFYDLAPNYHIFIRPFHTKNVNEMMMMMMIIIKHVHTPGARSRLAALARAHLRHCTCARRSLAHARPPPPAAPRRTARS